MASLSTLSINRPVLAIVMSITIILFGVIGFQFLGVREFPSVDPPIITVATSYTGANAVIIESQITEPLEESINGIAGVKTLTSVSRDGRSTITVEFDLEVDLERAANDVRDRVSRTLGALPPDVDPPIVTKADANSSPIIFHYVRSEKRSLLELTELAENTFKERFQTIPGVSSVQVWGAKRYSIRLRMDPYKMAAYKLSPIDVYNAVRDNNLELPSGRVEGLFTELTVRTLGRLNTPEEFDNLILKEEGDLIVKFRDVGNAVFAPENERTILKKDGIPMVIVVIIPQPGSNAVEIAQEYYRRLANIKKDLPADIDSDVGYDVTRYILQSIDEVRQTVIVAFLLVALIIFLFLRDWRTTIIPIITIPISLIGTFFIMYLVDFSINVLTMLGIVLAIGLVVDDTIVVLENIYKKVEQGMDPKQAGILGATEIFFAVISTTVALVAVFLPVIFLQGLTGRLFREFGFVVGGSVVISSFVALSLTAMLCTKILKNREKKPAFYRATEPFFIWLNKSYNQSLESFMKKRWLAFLIILISIGMIYWLGISLPSELAPKEDRNFFIMFSTGPEGATFEYMDQYVDEIIAAANEQIPEKDAMYSITSPGFGAASSVNSAIMFNFMKDVKDRERSVPQIIEAFTPQVMKNTKARTFIIQPETIGGGGFSLPVQYVIQAPTLDKLKLVLPSFLQKAYQDPTFAFVDLNLKFNKPEVKIEIDREKARSLGISVQDIAQTLQLGVSGQRFGFFILNGKQYQVIGQVDKENRNDPLDLRSIYLTSKSGELIQLDNMVKMIEHSVPPQLFRFNRYVSATVSAGLSPGHTIGDGIIAMDKIADEVLDDTYSTTLAGTSREFDESSSSLVFAFIFALALIYLTLAAQFESFKDPLIIMFTVPLAIAGALFSLWYFNETLNVFSQIGIIMLVGLVTKNGILIVEFANQKKAQGMEKMEAIIEAAESRFRPILMTSLSTILGILPIALALGAGSESRVSMGISVIGGLIFATVLTLYVIPAIYSYLSGKEKRMARF
ncbi:MAG: efflux RND transporter permease subunit [Bacteroidetes bacterium]|nr:efflux RND transporter permease subunit [Bacteroidota bacterium]